MMELVDTMDLKSIFYLEVQVRVLFRVLNLNNMDRKEYLNKVAELNHQIRMLKDDYITSNTDIPSGSYVIVTCEGKETRAYLKEYKIVDGYIKPVFNSCLKSGKRGSSYYDIPEFPGNITMRLA